MSANYTWHPKKDLCEGGGVKIISIDLIHKIIGSIRHNNQLMKSFLTLARPYSTASYKQLRVYRHHSLL